jgi:hypothetical protein
MKKYLSYILLLQLSFWACKKAEVDPLFSETANTRTTTVIDGYKKQLTSAEYGWKGEYYTDGGDGVGYSFYLKFDAAGKVSMYSDIDGFYYFTNGYDKAFESTYQVKALQKPTLIFDSYSYLHELVNPDYNGGPGKYADLELEVATVSDSKITFVGVKNKTALTLTKVTKTEADLLTKGLLGTNVKSVNNVTTFLVLTLPSGLKTDVILDLEKKQLGVLTFDKQGNPVITSASFVVTTTGLKLQNAISVGGSSFDEVLYDETLKSYYVMIGGKRYNITASLRPSLSFYDALGILFVGFDMNPAIPTQTAEYKALYTKIRNNVIALSTAAPARVIGNIYLQYLPNDGVFELIVEYRRTNTDGSYLFNGAAILYYQPSLDAKGNLSFGKPVQTATYSGGQFSAGASGIVVAGIKPLTDIIENNTFTWDFDTVEPKAALLKSNGTPSISIKGTLY